MPRIDAFLEIMQEAGASDLHLSSTCVPMLRINGVLQKARHRALTAEEVRLLMYELLTDSQIQRLEQEGELDCAYTLEGTARFRINVFRKHPGLAAAFRIIPHSVPTLDALGFPEVLKTMLKQRAGLILVTGPTNSGKSTTLAAMVDYLNEHMNYHIITLEDPLEFLHSNKNSLINQRQIGEHSVSFASALKGALREDPNVILVGEMRDLETIHLALTASELGLLVLGTLHTKSAGQTIGRIADVFPAEQQAALSLTFYPRSSSGSATSTPLEAAAGPVGRCEILSGNPVSRCRINPRSRVERASRETNDLTATTGKTRGWDKPAGPHR